VDFHNVVSKPAYSGLQKRTYPDPSSRNYQSKKWKLDNVLEPDFKVHLIKVDVEGAELVFKGAVQTLKHALIYYLSMVEVLQIIMELLQIWCTSYLYMSVV